MFNLFAKKGNTEKKNMSILHPYDQSDFPKLKFYQAPSLTFMREPRPSINMDLKRSQEEGLNAIDKILDLKKSAGPDKDETVPDRSPKSRETKFPPHPAKPKQYK